MNANLKKDTIVQLAANALTQTETTSVNAIYSEEESNVIP